MKLGALLGLPFACLTLLVATPAQAGLMHNSGTTPGQAYLDYADLYPEVGWLGRLNDSGQTVFRSSAVLIDPHWVLTAAHSVLQVSNDTDSFFDGYRVGFTDNFLAGAGENQFANAVYVHPDYNDVGSGPDLALLYFEDAFSIDPATLYSGPHVVGTPYDLVGFGRPGTPSTGLQSNDGQRRAGTNLLTNVDIPDGYIRARFSSPGLPEFQQLGILGTPGDSGGGWYVDINGMMQLAAITSDATSFYGYGSFTTATYFDSGVNAWIDSTKQNHAVPEPSSAALLLIGSAFGARALSRWRDRV